MVPLTGMLAALAAWLLIPHPAATLNRIRSPGRSVLPALITGRPGALPLRRRVLLGGAGALLAIALIDGPWGLVLAAGAWVLILVGSGHLIPAPRVEQWRDQLPDTLDFLAVCLEAGLPMRAALETVAEVAPEPTRRLLVSSAAQLTLGGAGQQVWQGLRDDPVWATVARDISRAEESGTCLAGVLRMHAEDSRRQSRDDALKRARTVGVRSVIPLMTCFLPAFILVGVVPIIAGLAKGLLG